MSKSVAKKLVKYRNYGVALGNAGVTWIILIIAPLGLWAVIICTFSVFVSSLVIGWLCDRTLYRLIGNLQPDVISAQWESDNIEVMAREYQDLPTQEERK
ncbi:hypothetical protein FJR38_02865 [Anabaena sp. UHCC 0253]|uniref:CRISPR-associated protein Csx18 n=1 Tax=Anabaena sp. UHCC 0253 TaxID=2590019 RepID=UPI0014460E9F|nr:CRISPR-associated protein Csx18 [Anabaena sp. UHCC 0253]MTJ51696.1 hypothetical protein [Anabaena sp. UHCC 0253]